MSTPNCLPTFVTVRSATPRIAEKSYRAVAFCFLLIIAVGCDYAPSSVELSPAEAELATAVGIDPATAQLIRGRGDAIERLTGFDDNWETVAANGILLITPSGRGKSTLVELRAALADTGYTTYLHDDSFGFGPDSIAVVADPDPFVYLGIVRLNGINYDVEHADVMKRLRAWDEMYGLELVGAGMDWMQAEFVNPPSDWNSFAAEVYKFCPDVVDQGSGSVEALAAELQEMNGVFLWWD